MKEKAEERLSSRGLFSDSSCPECGSWELTWHCQPQNRGGVQDGQIKMNEVGVIFFLGCDECSETVRIIDGDVVAVALTAIRSENVQEHATPTAPKSDRAMKSALEKVFSRHEERLKDAARDDANCGKAHALRSLPNARTLATADENQSNTKN